MVKRIELGYVVFLIIFAMYFLYFGFDGLYRIEIVYLLVGLAIYSVFVDLSKLNKQPVHKNDNHGKTPDEHKKTESENQ